MQARTQPATRPRVLLVDEHPVSRKAVAVMLRLQGFECIAVADVNEAFTAIERFSPDVAVLDWVFRASPEQGRGLAGRLRTRSQQLGKPLAVIVTSHADEPCGFREEEMVESYLTKPVEPHDLVAAIEEAMGSR